MVVIVCFSAAEYGYEVPNFWLSGRSVDSRLGREPGLIVSAALDFAVGYVLNGSI